MKNVIFVTDGFFHPPLLAQKALLQTLAEPAEFEFQHIRSMEKLPSDLDIFSALVIYIHHKKISEAALAKLDKFVSDGGGILGIHTATASFKEQSRYFEILGGRFIGHGPVTSFEVKPVADSDIFAGIPAFTVRDELYIHELQPGITAHFISAHEGQEIPTVWTHQYGKGRVCYAVPGHLTSAIKNKTYQKVLRKGLSWVCES